MKWLLFFVMVVLILGPLRRFFFRHWSFCIPATVTTCVMWHMVSALKSPAVPGWLAALCAVIGGVIAGGTCKEYLDQLFRKER
jgi:hypothetical protein